MLTLISLPFFLSLQVHLQAGQCVSPPSPVIVAVDAQCSPPSQGNQIGSAFWQTISGEHGLDSHGV